MADTPVDEDYAMPVNQDEARKNGEWPSASFHGNMDTPNLDFLKWTSEEVAGWIESKGFPQYKPCFTDNCITGRKLIFVDCVHMPRIGITDFKDMQGSGWKAGYTLDKTPPHRRDNRSKYGAD
ncbi:uncharacterized protein [Nerophis lumbriciformis]|uniref:uncharacterized protein isoform X3 n=1 Tax=Nerophis lumbriciformis TaxID=546530 RepID=UPI002AE00E73|nr:uncharacterized protein LOC133576473 isoform X3 [Nerophis lumbriciformis]